jgi:multidrug resistance efflux pump
MDMARKWVLISVAVVLTGLAIGAVSLVRRKPAAPPRSAGAVSLPGPDQNEVSLSGIIRPQHVTGVAAASPGVIESFLVELGDEVVAGQPLVRIGSLGLDTTRDSAANAVERAQDRVSRAEVEVGAARLEQSRAEAEAQRVSNAMDQAQKEYQKQNERFAKGAAPRKTFEASERDYQAKLEEYKLVNKGTTAAAEYLRTTQQALDTAKRDLDAKTQHLEDVQQSVAGVEVQAPVGGLVVGRNGDPGTPSQEAGERLIQIATDLIALEIPLEPEPPILSRIQPGLKVTIHLPAANQPIDGEVKRIDGTVVVVQFASPSPTIRPGMKAEVRFRLP